MPPTSPLIAIVDDNEDNLYITARGARDAGIPRDRCHTYTSGDELLSAIQQQDAQCYTLILLDILMPRKDGFAILQELRRLPRCQTIRVVAMTANIMESDRHRYQAAGFDGLIGKPTDPDDLPHQILAALHGKELGWPNPQ
ncbi:response regulator [Chloroflexia bacterium SDU3-3]|nr:response regulator [Chloroflexia bacterium SDU3-3]